MSYLGIGGGSGTPPGENQYGSGGYINQPYYLTLGRVLSGDQAAQFYTVSLDQGGQTNAIYLGSGRGRLGVNEAGGILPGERVLVAIPFATPQIAIIVARFDYAKAGAYRPPCGLLVTPQVAGFEYGARMSGAINAEFPRSRTYNSGILDVVDGEWVMHNMFGGAVGVEMFRTFLQGGPMCGVYCYSEDQHLRLLGARLELLTVGREELNYIVGNGVADMQKQFYYVEDQPSGYQPQDLRISGPSFGGRQNIISYPDGMNGSGKSVEAGPEDVGESRVAMIHEYRGADGSYALTAAGTILLQKSVEVPVPIDVLEANDSKLCQDLQQEGEENGALFSCDDPDQDPNAVEDSSSMRFDNYERGNPLAFAINARGLADRLVLWQAMGGFATGSRWKFGTKPERIYGGKESKDFLISKSPSMWKCMPQSIKLAIEPTGTSKRFYMGRAMFMITEDGSVVIQDAQGSQIMMSGGNIYLSAQHDVITTAGRNKLDIAGRDTGIRSGRHLDLMANEGRLTAMAAGQTSIVGGLDGSGGVLIESKGNYHATNSTGENPANSGGVIIKGRHFVGLQADQIALRANKPTGWSGQQNGSGLIILDAGDQVQWRAKNASYFGSFGSTISAQLDRTNISLGGVTSVIDGHLWVTNDIWYHRERRIQQQGSVNAAYRCANNNLRLEEFQRALMEFQNNPLQLDDGFMAKWLKSNQYSITGSRIFTIPEPEWQHRANEKFAPNSSIVNAGMYDNKVDGTSPFPGAEAWDGNSMSKSSYVTPDFGDEPTVNLNLTRAPLEGGLLKGI